MDKFQLFEQKIENMDYIQNPYNYVYDNEENFNSYELLEFIRIIHYHNQTITEQISDETKALTSIIKSAQPIKEISVESRTDKKIIVDNSYTYPQDSQVEQIIKSLEYYKNIEEFKNNIRGINEQGIYKIKLHLLKLVINTTKKVELTILKSAISDLTELQIKLLNYKEFLEVLKEKQVIETNECPYQDQQLSYNIILVPNNKSSTYLFEDITSYPESYDEITLTFDNIMSQQIFNSKSIRQIRDKSEKLFEYKRKNGIRVMFIKNGNNIFVTSLFYKDKQRSTKIDHQYDEAIKRYTNFIESNTDYTSIDFSISQKELIGDIYSEIESGITYKKVGDINE